jgi:hypothetical protein
MKTQTPEQLFNLLASIIEPVVNKPTKRKKT